MSTMRTALAGVTLAMPLLAFANPALLAEVKAADAAYWTAYNSCDYAALDALTAENVEFYHDVAGSLNGRAALTDAVRKNICGDATLAIRRTAQDKDGQAYLLNRGPDVYGAIVTGRHAFTNSRNGGAAVPVDEARYTMLWLRDGKGWKLSRALSYEHKSLQKAASSTAVTLSEAALEQFAGSYAAKAQPVFVLKRDGANLSVEVGGRPTTLYPKNANTFFIKGRNIEVEFKPAVDGRVPGFIVRENGQQVEEGKRM
jgi:ketosteroid isomerase-like protein